jgi:hypothetical protein
MKKLALIVFLVACNKPSEGDCRKAVQRIRELQGTANIEGASDIEAAVRSCRGNASKESVKCAMEASSLEALERCGILSQEEIDEIKAEQEAQREKDAKGTK